MERRFVGMVRHAGRGLIVTAGVGGMETVKKTAKLPGVKAMSLGNKRSPKGWGYYMPLPGVRYYVYVNEEKMKTPKVPGRSKDSGTL